ncbi:MAG: histidine phosphatase family protein [Chloroflexota bacterium]
MSIELVYETHAITTDNEAGIATGWLPGVLSAAGHDSARELGARRRDDGIATVYVSDLARAVETARIAFADAPLPIVVDARLRECNYGRMNGMPRAQLDLERASHLDVPWPGGESYRDVVARTASFLEDVAHGADGIRVLVIAHSANEWALEHLLRGADLPARVAAGMTWQPGWEFVVPRDWRAPVRR